MKIGIHALLLYLLVHSKCVYLLALSIVENNWITLFPYESMLSMRSVSMSGL